MSDPEKILSDLKAMTKTIQLDRTELAGLNMTAALRKEIHRNVIRCIQSLRELEAATERRDGYEDFPI